MNKNVLFYSMALMNSKIAGEMIQVLSPTLNFEVGNIAKIPMIIKEEEKVLSYTKK